MSAFNVPVESKDLLEACEELLGDANFKAKNAATPQKRLAYTTIAADLQKTRSKYLPPNSARKRPPAARPARKQP